jgi:hypothetical protein
VLMLWASHPRCRRVRPLNTPPTGKIRLLLVLPGIDLFCFFALEAFFLFNTLAVVAFFVQNSSLFQCFIPFV